MKYTIEAIKDTMETMLPKEWEYCHDIHADTVIEEDIDFDAMDVEGWTIEEIAEEIINQAISLEKRVFNHAMDKVGCDYDNLDGLDYDEDYGFSIVDGYFTDAHGAELVEAAEEALQDAIDNEKEIEGLLRDYYRSVI